LYLWLDIASKYLHTRLISKQPLTIYFPIQVTFPSFTLTISGNSVSLPTGPAIVVSLLMTGVNEQTAANYARAPSSAGFYALTFDAGYQSENSGEPSTSTTKSIHHPSSAPTGPLI
jgi:fermentation-respiration switch protein FrsA (DUF1100 family)